MAVTSNLAQFQLGIRRFERKAEERRKGITKAVALRALQGLVSGTRVDTGRARGNWQLGEGAPPEGFDESKTDKTGSSTIGIGSREILAMEGDEVIWLHNGVPYIGVLEDKDKMLAGNVQALRAWLKAQP